MYTLCEMLGIDEKDRHKIVRWMHYLENAQYIIGNPDAKVSPWFIMKFFGMSANVSLWPKDFARPT